MADAKSIGKNLKAARATAGLTQEEAAKRSGLSKQAISGQERGAYAPTEANLQVLAELYRTTAVALRYGPGKNGQPPTQQAGDQAHRIRVWKQEFLLKIAKAKATDQELENARRLLDAPELHTFFVSGEEREMDEADWLLTLEAIGAAIIATLKKRGRKFPAK